MNAAARKWPRPGLHPVIGQGLGQIALIGITPVLTRLYSPDDFGILQFAMLAAACAVPIVTLRADLVIPALKRVAVMQRLTRLSFKIGSGVGSVLIVTAGTLAYFGAMAAAEILAMATLIMAVLAWNLIDSAVLVRAGELTRLGVRNAINGIAAAVFQVCLGIVLPVPLSLAIALALARALSVLVTRRTDTDFDTASGMERYDPRQASAGVATGILLAFSLQSPSAVLGLLHGPSAAGQAATAQRVAGGPTTLVGLAIGQVVAARVAHSIQQGSKNIHSYLVRMATMLLIVSSVVGGLLAVIFLNYSELIFGSSWSGIGIVIALLVPLYVVQFAVTPITVVLPLIDKQSLLLKFELARVVILIGSIVGASVLTGSLWAALGAWTIVGSALYCVLGALTLHKVRHL